MYVFMYVCMYVCIYVCMYIYICICIYRYVYVYIERERKREHSTQKIHRQETSNSVGGRRSLYQIQATAAWEE